MKNKLPCLQCDKFFMGEYGLKWHQEHIHGKTCQISIEKDEEVLNAYCSSCGFPVQIPVCEVKIGNIGLIVRKKGTPLISVDFLIRCPQCKNKFSYRFGEFDEKEGEKLTGKGELNGVR